MTGRIAVLRILGLVMCASLVSACDDAATTRNNVRANGPVERLPMGLVEQQTDQLRSMSNDELVAAIEAAVQQAARGPEDLTFAHVQADGVDMLIFVASAEGFEAAMVGLDSRHGTGVTALNAISEGGLQLVIGSGFVSELYTLAPVGLLRIDGVTVNEIQRHGYTRVLGVGERGFGVVSHREFQQGLFDSALQAGPGVIEAGLLDISERDLQRTPYFRALVGVCGDKALFGITMIPMHLRTAGQAVLGFAAAESLACDEVVNLAGDREAVLALRRDDGAVIYLGNPRTSKVALVGLRRRRS